MFEYMNYNVRAPDSDKNSVHYVNNSSDSGRDSDLITLIKQMNEEQQLKNKELESFIVNLTEMV